MGFPLVASASGGAAVADRLADAARMLGGTRERLGRLAERLTELRAQLGAAARAEAAAGGTPPEAADAKDPSAR